MNNWLVFVGMDYYPEGGSYDFCGFAKDEEEAREIAKSALDRYGPQDAWAHYCHLSNMRTVEVSNG